MTWNNGIIYFITCKWFYRIDKNIGSCVFALCLLIYLYCLFVFLFGLFFKKREMCLKVCLLASYCYHFMLCSFSKVKVKEVTSSFLVGPLSAVQHFSHPLTLTFKFHQYGWGDTGTFPGFTGKGRPQVPLRALFQTQVNTFLIFFEDLFDLFDYQIS